LGCWGGTGGVVESLQMRMVPPALRVPSNLIRQGCLQRFGKNTRKAGVKRIAKPKGNWGMEKSSNRVPLFPPDAASSHGGRREEMSGRREVCRITGEVSGVLRDKPIRPV
jgi:hypothetical protein